MNTQCWEGNVKDMSVGNKRAVLNDDQARLGDSEVCIRFYRLVS
jgi:hypothetical protein